jgi:GNAT superfamily N-acetyltransferase
MNGLSSGALHALRLQKSEELGWRKGLKPLPSGHFLHWHDEGSHGATVSAYAPNGLMVGSAQFTHNLRAPVNDEDPSHLVRDGLRGWDVFVHKDHRRRGLARAMYEHAEERSGKKIVPGSVQTDDGKAFWLGKAEGPFRSAGFRHRTQGHVVETGAYHNIEPWLKGGSHHHMNYPTSPAESQDWEAGFVTHDGAFMNREQATAHVGAQLGRHSVTGKQRTELDSSDLASGLGAPGFRKAAELETGHHSQSLDEYNMPRRPSAPVKGAKDWATDQAMVNDAVEEEHPSAQVLGRPAPKSLAGPPEMKPKIDQSRVHTHRGNGGIPRPYTWSAEAANTQTRGFGEFGWEGSDSEWKRIHTAARNAAHPIPAFVHPGGRREHFFWADPKQPTFLLGGNETLSQGPQLINRFSHEPDPNLLDEDNASEGVGYYMRDGRFVSNQRRTTDVHGNPPADPAIDHLNAWLAANPMAKTELRKTEPNLDEDDAETIGDMHGFMPHLHANFLAAKFLAGKTEPIAFDKLRQLLYQHDGDTAAAALNAHGLIIDDANRKALAHVRKLQDLSKHEQQLALKSVTAGAPEAQGAADDVNAALGHDDIEPVTLNGKHSRGSMLARSSDSGTTWLLKPGSGGTSPASGVKEVAASQSQREAAFWHVAERWNLGEDIPRTDLLLIDGRQYAAIKMLDFRWKNASKIQEQDANRVLQALGRYRESGRLHMWATLDFICGNPDRHGANVMIGGDDELRLIDHGSAFAGAGFDPANDGDSFVPFYLRAWINAGKFLKMSVDQKLVFMPTVSPEVRGDISAWIQGLDAQVLVDVLGRYGIDPSASLRRLARVKGLRGNIDQDLNRLWVTV